MNLKKIGPVVAILAVVLVIAIVVIANWTTWLPDFYVYYDITVDVPWGSSTAFPFLSKSVWDNKGFKNIEYSDPANQDVTDAQRFIRWHSDSTVETYTYRYVLLN